MDNEITFIKLDGKKLTVKLKYGQYQILPRNIIVQKRHS